MLYISAFVYELEIKEGSICLGDRSRFRMLGIDVIDGVATPDKDLRLAQLIWLEHRPTSLDPVSHQAIRTVGISYVNRNMHDSDANLCKAMVHRAGGIPNADSLRGSDLKWWRTTIPGQLDHLL